MSQSSRNELYEVKEYGSEHDDIVLLLSSWKATQWMYWPVAQILKQHGFCCMVFTYPDQTLSPDIEDTKRRVSQIRDSIVALIREKKFRSRSRSIHIFGTSLGALLALLVANESKEISRVFLNVPGFDMCESVWGWDEIVPAFKNDLLNQGISLSLLKKEWDSLRPVHNLEHLSETELLVCLAEYDKVARSTVSEVRKHLDAHVRNYRLIINKGMGHNMAAVLNLLNPRRYLNFFRYGIV